MMPQKPMQYFLLLFALVLFAPACKQSSQLKIFFKDGIRKDADLSEAKMTFKVLYNNQSNNLSCSAFLVDIDLLMTAAHCKVGPTARVISGKRYLAEQSGNEPVPNGEVVGNALATDEDRDIAIYRVKWLFDSPDSSEVIQRIWTKAEEHPVKLVQVPRGNGFVTESVFTNPFKAYTVGFPHDKDGPSFSNGTIIKMTNTLGSDGRQNPSIQASVGWTSGNSGGFVAEYSTGKLLGVVSTSGKIYENHKAGNDTTVYDRTNANILNQAHAIYDIYVNGPLSSTLQSIYDANGYHKKFRAGGSQPVGPVPSTNTSTGSIQPIGPTPSTNTSIGISSPTKHAKIGFVPGLSSTKVLITALGSVQSIRICGGEGMSCSETRSLSQNPNNSDMHLLELTKEIPHSITESLPLVLVMGTVNGVLIQENFDIERVL